MGIGSARPQGRPLQKQGKSMELGKKERKTALAACLFLTLAYTAPAVSQVPIDPQTALMTVVEPKIEADTISASPMGDDYDPVSGTITFSARSEEHTSALQSLMRISYAVFCLNKN